MRSSTLLLSVRSVDWTSELRQPPPCPEDGGTAGQSSPESSEADNREYNMIKNEDILWENASHPEKYMFMPGIGAAAYTV